MESSKQKEPQGNRAKRRKGEKQNSASNPKLKLPSPEASAPDLPPVEYEFAPPHSDEASFESISSDQLPQDYETQIQLNVQGRWGDGLLHSYQQEDQPRFTAEQDLGYQ